MAAGKLVWDAVGEKFWETGCDHGVLYPYDDGQKKYGDGVAWNGLTNVTESPSGAEATDLWADNIKYGTILSAESFGGTIEAYMSPPEFDACDGAAELAPGVIIRQQTRKSFGFCWRTRIGNDVSEDVGYKLHIAYGCKASPSEKSSSTVNDSPEASTLSWEFTSTPVNVTNMKPSAVLEIDSRTADPTKLKALEDILYGKDAVDEPTTAAVAARLPLPDEIKELMSEE